MNKKNEHIIKDVKTKLREGNFYYEIIEYLQKQYPEQIPSNFRAVQIFNETNDIIERELDFNAESIISKHTARYETIYKRNIHPVDRKTSTGNRGNPKKKPEELLPHYLIAMDALKRKEKVLGIVHNRMDMQFTNTVKQSTTDEVSSLDLSKLDMEEKKRFLYLLKKAKGDIKEQTTITTTVSVNYNEEVNEEQKYDEGVVDQFETEDVDYEDVTEGKSAFDVYKTINEANKRDYKKIDRLIRKKKMLDKMKKDQ